MVRPARLALIILGVVTILAYGAYWFFASRALSDGVERWADDMRHQGYHVSMGRFDVGGFPLHMRFDVTDFVIEAPFGVLGGDKSSAWRFNASEVSVDKRPWELDLINISLPGTYEITRQMKGGAVRSFFAVADTARGSVSLNLSGQPTAAVLRISGLSAATEMGPLGDEMRLREAQVSLRRNAFEGAADKNTPSFSLSVMIEDLYLSGAKKLALGAYFPRVEGEALVMGVLGDGPLVAAASLWRDQGGTVEVPALTLHWGNLEMEGEGTLALDENMQPMGALATRVRGFEKTLKALSEDGLVRPTTAATAGIVLGLLAKPTDDGGGKILKAPLSVQNRNLFIGPVKLLELPRVVWE